VKVRDLVTRYGAGTLDTFAHSCPFPHLIQVAWAEQMPESGFFTQRGSSDSLKRTVDYLDCPVFPIRKIDESNFSRMIMVGRANNNDVVLRTSKVSKFHAFFSRKQDGWYIQDSGSSNGTYIRQTRLEPKVPTKLESSSEVGFSQALRLLFLETEPMFLYLRGLADKS